MPVISTIYYYAGIVNYTTGDVVWSLDWNETSPGIPPYIDNTGLPPDQVGVVFTSVAFGGGAAGTATITATVDGIPTTPSITAFVPPIDAPVVDFSADPLSGNASLNVNFTDLSTNTPTFWEWDFTNDGIVDSTDQNPVHIYSDPGTYTVKLTASNSGGSGTETKIGYITVISPPLFPFASIYTSTGFPTFGDISMYNGGYFGVTRTNGNPNVVIYDSTKSNIVNSWKSWSTLGTTAPQNNFLTVAPDTSFYYVTTAVFSGNSSIRICKMADVNTQTWGVTIPRNGESGLSNGYPITTPDSGVLVPIFSTTSVPSARYAGILKFDSLGNLEWERRINITSYSSSSVPRLTIDSLGNIYAYIARPTAGSNNSFLFKYNSSGVLQWQQEVRPYASLSGTVSYHDIGIDSADNVYLLLSLSNNSTLIKLSSAGTVLSQYVFSAVGFNVSVWYYIHEMKVNSDGSVFLPLEIYKPGSIEQRGWMRIDSSGTITSSMEISILPHPAQSMYTPAQFSEGDNSICLGMLLEYSQVVACLPTDGTETGTYTEGASTINYQPLTSFTPTVTSSLTATVLPLSLTETAGIHVPSSFTLGAGTIAGFNMVQWVP